jgi:archaellum component FlaF (FlaF/FlaG flagellin family)
MHQYTCRRGVASIIGAAFLILILISGYTFYALTSKSTSQLQDTLRKISSQDIDKGQEKINFKDVSPYTDAMGSGIKVTAANVGSKIVTLKYIATLVEIDRYAQYRFLDPLRLGMDYSIEPSTFESYEVPIPEFSLSGKYLIKFITEKGNIFTVGYPYVGEPTITTSLSLIPTSDDIGKPVIVSGSGFTPYSTITIYFDGIPLATTPGPVIATASGSFSATFNVPDSSVGGHSVKAMDENFHSAIETFTTRAP